MQYLLSENFEFNFSNTKITAPVTFLKGNAKSILDGIPYSQNKTVQAGYIQFRAFNNIGFASAVCPGVK